MVDILGKELGLARPKRLIGECATGDRLAGSVERVEALKSYSALRLRVMVRLARLKERVPVPHGIDLYRVSYWTEHRGTPELASGLLALPRGASPRGTVTWLNGTNPTRAEAPSSGGLLGVQIAAAFAGSGFVLLAPDYVGLGVSRIYHPYMYAPTTESACIDFMTAAKAVIEALGYSSSPNMMLVGFSQGGFSTAVVHRALEKSPRPGIEVIAAAGLASPLDLAGVSLPWGFNGESTAHSLYLAFVANAYSLIYGQRLDSVVTDDFAALIPELFDGEHTSDDIVKRLPREPREMFRPGVEEAFLAGEPSWFLNAVKENEAVDWVPRAPLRLYYGEADVDVPPDDSLRAAQRMRERGGNVEALSLGPVDHARVSFIGVPRVLKWFIELNPE